MFVVIRVFGGVPVGCLLVVYLRVFFVVCVFFCGRIFCLMLVPLLWRVRRSFVFVFVLLMPLFM